MTGLDGFKPDVPAPDEITAPWWEATKEHRLMLQTCPSCARVQHPPRALCTHCGSDELDWVTSGGLGVVDSFTVVHRAPRPDLTVPYVIARVRLAEEVVLLTRLQEREPDEWRIGEPVRVAWVDLDDGRALPVFVPDVPSSH
ncbi:Zn-ribbon domain-containing OB-fold protein [Actinomadura latina]|uniref:Zn-ribbon domain-containing OB-fold protein n=1 Tax=Actinomadura latina TaxID=163603 RepID=A0A846YZB4_9ACTN|nr:Zn-ribbon domain-containing OB-fold protein [Actinomadura latina]NKZ03466.1 Zn-ribbon domain-containing OB-fold protein [Actinomadura latina]